MFWYDQKEDCKMNSTMMENYIIIYHKKPTLYLVSYKSYSYTD